MPGPNVSIIRMFYCIILFTQALLESRLIGIGTNAFSNLCSNQGLREAVKNTGRWAKQAFIRLEVRVMRPTKLKIKQLESGSDGKEPISKLSGADTHSPLSPEEEYLSSLDGQEHHDF